MRFAFRVSIVLFSLLAIALCFSPRVEGGLLKRILDRRRARVQAAHARLAAMHGAPVQSPQGEPMAEPFEKTADGQQYKIGILQECKRSWEAQNRELIGLLPKGVSEPPPAILPRGCQAEVSPREEIQMLEMEIAALVSQNRALRSKIPKEKQPLYAPSRYAPMANPSPDQPAAQKTAGVRVIIGGGGVRIGAGHRWPAHAYRYRGGIIFYSGYYYYPAYPGWAWSVSAGQWVQVGGVVPYAPTKAEPCGCDGPCTCTPGHGCGCKTAAK